jgi:hypothetical protein
MSHVGSPELTPRQTSRNLPTSPNHGKSDLGEEVLNALETYKQKDIAKGDSFLHAFRIIYPLRIVAQWWYALRVSGMPRL